MLRDVYVDGFLGEQFGRLFKLDISSPAESIRAIEANRPGFSRAILDASDKGVAYQVYVDDNTIPEEYLTHPISMTSSIRIVPVVVGAGSKDIINIIVGVALIAAVFFFPQSAIFAAPLFAEVTVGTVIASIGISLALSGVAGLLTPTPSTSNSAPEESPESQPSTSFNGAVNTMSQGHPVPVGYGRMLVGSQVISVALANEARSV